MAGWTLKWPSHQSLIIPHEAEKQNVEQNREPLITSSEEHVNFPGVTFINGTSRVVRIDSPKAGDHDFGVALEFISAKFFDFLIKSS